MKLSNIKKYPRSLSINFWGIYLPLRKGKLFKHCGGGYSESGSIQVCDQSSMVFKIGSIERPFSVKEYSIMTGVSGMTSRLIIAFCSNSFSRSDNTFPLIPIADWISLNLCEPGSN